MPYLEMHFASMSRAAYSKIVINYNEIDVYNLPAFYEKALNSNKCQMNTKIKKHK